MKDKIINIIIKKDKIFKNILKKFFSNVKITSLKKM